MQLHVQVAVPASVLRVHQPRQPLQLPCKATSTGGRPRYPGPCSVVVIRRPTIAGLLCLPFCPKAYLIRWGNVPITFLRWRMIDL